MDSLVEIISFEPSFLQQRFTLVTSKRYPLFNSVLCLLLIFNVFNAERLASGSSLYQLFSR